MTNYEKYFSSPEKAGEAFDSIGCIGMADLYCEGCLLNQNGYIRCFDIRNWLMEEANERSKA